MTSVQTESFFATPYGEVGLRGEFSFWAESEEFPKISDEQAK